MSYDSPLNLDSVLVEVRNKDLERIGAIASGDLNLEASPLLNGGGRWRLELPTDHPMHAPLSEPGAGIIIYTHGVVFDSGFVDMPTTEAVSDRDEAVTTFTGALDLALLWDRLCYPDPTTGDTMAQAADYDVIEGQASSVLHDYVKKNIGPAAVPSRRNAKILMDADPQVGPIVSKSARFDNLGEFTSGIASAHSLVMSLAWESPSSLHFHVGSPVDRTGTMRLSLASQTLTSQKIARVAPTLTHVVAGKQEVDFDRLFALYSTEESSLSAAVWNRRIERWVDDSQDTTIDWDNPSTEPTNDALKLLKEEGGTHIAMQGVPSESVGEYRYGRDWRVGDYITVMFDSTEQKAQVTGAVLTVGTGGASLGILLGDSTLFSPLARLAAEVAALQQDVSVQQRQPIVVNEGGISKVLIDPAWIAEMDAQIASAQAAAQAYAAAQVALEQERIDGDLAQIITGLGETVDSVYQTSRPSPVLGQKMVWYDTDNLYSMEYWDGAVWEVLGTGRQIIGQTFNGVVMSAPIIQTSTAAGRGIKLVANENGGYGSLIAYDGSGTATFTLNGADGSIAMLGGLVVGAEVQAGTITGALVQSTNGRIKFSDFGFVATNTSGNPTLAIDGATGDLTMVGTLSSSTINSPTISGGTISGTTFIGQQTFTEGFASSAPLYVREAGPPGSAAFGGNADVVYMEASHGTIPVARHRLALTAGGDAYLQNGWDGYSTGGFLHVGQMAVAAMGSTTSGANVFAGSLGILQKSTSTRRNKTNIRPMDVDVDAMLALSPQHYTSLCEADDPDLLNVGFIAEDAHDLGLHEWVYYDDEGQPNAFAYDRWATALQAIAQRQAQQILALTERVTDLENS